MVLYNINNFHNSAQDGVLVVIISRTAPPSGRLSSATDYATLTHFFLKRLKQLKHFYTSASFT